MLCIKNESIEEICPIIFTPLLILSTGISLNLTNKLIINDYSRDEKLLRMKPNCCVTFESVSGQKKFIGFAKYLRDRKKVCVLYAYILCICYIISILDYIFIYIQRYCISNL